MFESEAHYTSQTGEEVTATIRQLDVAVQAIDFRVDATMVRFQVDAILVASDTNAQRRLHFFYEVEFTDGPNGDDGLVMIAGFKWPDEVVIFTDSGLQVTLPFHWGDDEAVIFAESTFRANWSINYAEFVTLADYAVSYVLDFHWADALAFTDLSVAWQGIGIWADDVRIDDTLTMIGGNSIALHESVTISEVMIGGPAVIFGDSVFMAEVWSYVLDFQIQPDSVTWTDTLVVSQVAATDARPGAFIPGSALLGSPT